ncbi:MAG: YdeI/OmpD-associated family protein [Chloroflexota bacterium]
MGAWIEMTIDPTFFATPADFRTWLEEHHHKSQELWVGYYKKGTGRPSITWPESVDEALCFGWIDGLRQRVDENSYMIRFTPRKASSTWSAVNLKRVEELIAQERMHPAGLKVFEERRPEKSGLYSYEQRETAALDAAQAQQFQANPRAWEFFQAQPAWYRQAAMWWVVSAKQEATRQKRLAILIEDSAQGRPIRPLVWRGQSK